MSYKKGTIRLSAAFTKSEYEQLKDEQSESWSPCDDCDINYINCCSSCHFASSSINESLNYSDEG